jgi:hypothetical protein
MAEKLDPTVQIRIIDLANSWLGNIQTHDNTSLKTRAELFGLIYRAIVKNIEPQ